MRLFYYVLVQLVGFALSVEHQLAFKIDSEWLGWKKEHSRAYETDIHELERYVTWKSNKAYIEAHNQLRDQFGFHLALNQFGDLSSNEYYYATRCLTDYDYSAFHGHSTEQSKLKRFEWPHGLNLSSLPVEVDWRTMGAVTGVKDQGRCHSCYAFAVTGALEGMAALATGNLASMSEQQIVDCSVIYGNQGCSGGSREVALLYIVDHNGISTSEDYPYIGYQYLCRQSSSSNPGTRTTGMVKVTKGSEDDLMAAVAIAGPVTVGVDHLHSSFQFYAGGIFDEPSCSYTKLTHSMLIIGYGTSNGKDYWLIKNSWGTTWGDNGYIKMVRGKYNQCGIASRAIYPST